MRKILIFSTAYLPHIGGAEVAVKEITERIGDFQFDLITARMDRKIPSTEKMGNINVYRVGFGFKTLDKFILPFLGCLKAAGLHKEGPYAIVWSIMASQASIAAAFFKNKFPAVKLLLTLQEGDEEEHLKRYAFGSGFLYRVFIRPWHLLVFKRADYIFAISNYLRQRALLYGIKAPVEIVPNGVDIGKFQIPNNKFQINFKFQISNFKKKLGIKEGEKVIITASRLVEKNAVADIIEALRYLPENVKLLILGAGPLDKNLKLKTQDLKLQDRVIFFGKYDNDALPSYLAISDVFVRPSLSEGQGISFLEAMAAGVPIIGTPVGGIPDFLTEGETGLFCEARNPQSIAEKVKLLLTDDVLRQKIATNAKKLVKEKYDWDFIAERMRVIFDKLAVK